MLQVYEILGQESRKEQGIKQTGRNPQFPPRSLPIYVNIPLLENKIIRKIKVQNILWRCYKERNLITSF